MRTFDIDVYAADRKIGEFTDLNFDTTTTARDYCRGLLSPELSISIWEVKEPTVPGRNCKINMTVQ